MYVFVVYNKSSLYALRMHFIHLYVVCYICVCRMYVVCMYWCILFTSMLCVIITYHVYVCVCCKSKCYISCICVVVCNNHAPVVMTLQVTKTVSLYSNRDRCHSPIRPLTCKSTVSSIANGWLYYPSNISGTGKTVHVQDFILTKQSLSINTRTDQQHTYNCWWYAKFTSCGLC